MFVQKTHLFLSPLLTDNYEYWPLYQPSWGVTTRQPTNFIHNDVEMKMERGSSQKVENGVNDVGNSMVVKGEK